MNTNHPQKDRVRQLKNRHQKARKALRNRAKRIARRIAPRQFESSPAPLLGRNDARYEVSERCVATRFGALPLLPKLFNQIGLTQTLNDALHLLKAHLPYHESDHIYAIAMAVTADFKCIEGLEILRTDEALLKALGTPRLPDPTTSRDYLMRHNNDSIQAMMDAVNAVRVKVWKAQNKAFLNCAVIDADGSIVGTGGEKKAGAEMSYNGEYGCHPLLVSLAQTQEPLFVVNRPGNVASHDGAAEYLDRAVKLARAAGFENVILRGDTDFSQTKFLDGWDADGVKFVFGYDARENLIEIAEALDAKAWNKFELPEPFDGVRGPERSKRINYKDLLVIRKNWTCIRTVGEFVASFPYKPTACSKTYRMVVLKKDLAVERGEPTLIANDVRYFFFITNLDESDLSDDAVVQGARWRCNQENLIAALKGLGALKLPSHTLAANWAYMVAAALAWTFKAWLGLTLPRLDDRMAVIKMEYKHFLNTVVAIPAQVVSAARGTVAKLLAWTENARLIFAAIEGMASLASSG